MGTRSSTSTAAGRRRASSPRSDHGGDRESSIERLAGHSFDVVVDTSGYEPSTVALSVRQLSTAAEHYTLVSSVSVYADVSAPGVDETGALTVVPADELERATRETHYGGLKALCEQEVERGFPGRSLVIRPGLIVGPYGSHRAVQLLAAPPCARRRGTCVAPKGAPSQVIDVRDLAAGVACAEARQTGVFNAVGPASPLSFESLLDVCRAASGSDATISWVDERFLLEEGVEPMDRAAALDPVVLARLRRVRRDRRSARGRCRTPAQAAPGDRGGYARGDGVGERVVVGPGTGGRAVVRSGIGGKHEQSLWLQEALADEDDAAPLEGEEHADVCIVGGGYTGLWTALRLKEHDPSLDVVIVEADVCGGGRERAERRVRDELVEQVPEARTPLREEEALRLARASAEAVSAIGAFCEAHSIDADFREDGWLWAATKEAQIGAWEETVAATERAGVDAFVRLDPDEAARRAGSPTHIAGVFEPTCATVQPARLARGLRRVALEQGVRIFEHSPMTPLERAFPARVHTTLGVGHGRQGRSGHERVARAGA